MSDIAELRERLESEKRQFEELVTRLRERLEAEKRQSLRLMDACTDAEARAEKAERQLEWVMDVPGVREGLAALKEQGR